MKKTLLRALVSGALLLAAMPASAATLFTITGLPGTSNTYRYSFSIPDGRAPTTPLSDSTRFNGIVLDYSRPGESTIRTETGPFDGVTFFTQAGLGGLQIARFDAEPIQFQQVRFFGPQLFTGTTAAPVFRPGSYDVPTVQGSAATYRITISDTAAVPEPATWAMMIAGFGMTGAALRRRARPVRAAQA